MCPGAGFAHPPQGEWAYFVFITQMPSQSSGGGVARKWWQRSR